MSTQQRLASAIALIEQYNSDAEQDDRIDLDLFQKKLKKIGGTTEELLAELKWEDLQVCGLPTLLARKVASIFRNPIAPAEKMVGEKSAQRMPPLYLLQSYVPGQQDNVTKRLKELSFGKKFIVFNTDGSVHVEQSLKLLKEIIAGYEAREEVDFDGRIGVKTFAAGDSTGTIVDENPLYLNRPLRPDGTCDQTNRSWDGVSAEIRQLLRLAVYNTGEVENFGNSKAHDLIDLAVSPDAESKIRVRFRKAAALLEDLKQEGKAPTLKYKLKPHSESSRSNSPFGRNRTY